MEIIGGSTQPNKPLDVGIVFFVFVPRISEFVLFLRPPKGYGQMELRFADGAVVDLAGVPASEQNLGNSMGEAFGDGR